MNVAADSFRPETALPLPNWSELNRRWLIEAIGRLSQRIRARASGQPGSAAFEPVADWDAATAEDGFVPALAHCARVFRLSPFERELLLLAAGLELDRELREAVLAANDAVSVRATFGLALAVLTEPHWDALSPDGALRYWRMVRLLPDAPLTAAELVIDERALHFIAGIGASDPVLAGVATHLQPAVADAVDLDLVHRLAATLDVAERRGPLVLLQADGDDHVARRETAQAVAAHLERPALWIEAAELPVDPGGAARFAIHVDREVALTGALPILSVVNAAGEQAAGGLVAHVRSATLWVGTGEAARISLPHGGRILRFVLPPADAERGRAALHARVMRAVPDPGCADLSSALDRAARQFHLGSAAIDAVVAEIQSAAPADRAATVWRAAREATRRGLDDIARRIEPQVGLDDVVLPAAHAAVLRDVVRQLKHRDRVYRTWGFGAKSRLGQGLVALFAGESGTGKTLAAEAVAREAELDLYRIDLAAIVSKYIGETEKNLKRLFDAADSNGAVLLFDEADALFGKRSDVKDSHDRYANIEVAYLLQRVEAYRGLAILTTNMKSALDRAFLRRIRFVVTFPLPDAAAREQIWRQQFPAEAPVGAVDFAALARLTLTGASIRNIALAAAFKAADAGAPIDQSLVLAAAREEYVKLERPVTELGGIGR